MTSGHSSKEEIDAALGAIKRFDELNAEAAKVLGRDESNTGESLNATAKDPNSGNGDAPGVEDVQRILDDKIWNNSETEAATTGTVAEEEGLNGETLLESNRVINGSDNDEPVERDINNGVVGEDRDDKSDFKKTDYFDESWSCATDSDSQASVIVKDILASASQNVQNLVGVGEASVNNDSTLHPYSTSFKSVSPRSSSPLNQEDRLPVSVAKQEPAGSLNVKSESDSDFPDSTDESSTFYSDSEADINEEKNDIATGDAEDKVLSDRLKTLRNQFSDTYYNNFEQNQETNNLSSGRSDTSDVDSENETKFILDGNVVDKGDLLDGEPSETVRDSPVSSVSPTPQTQAEVVRDSPNPQAVAQEGDSPIPSKESDRAESPKPEAEVQGNLWKTPDPIIESNTFKKDEGENLDSDRRIHSSDNREEVPSLPEGATVWRAPQPLTSSPTREAILNSEQTVDTDRSGEVQDSGVWNAPAPIISPRTPREDDKSFAIPGDDVTGEDSSPERRGLWQAPYPMVSRDSFPPVSEKDSADEFAMKFEAQKAESELAATRAQDNGLGGNKTAKMSGESNYEVPSDDELLDRFQRLRSEDDLMSNIPAGSASKEAAIEEEPSDPTINTKKTIAEQAEDWHSESSTASVSAGKPTEKSDIFSTQNFDSKFYQGYIDVAKSDQEGSVSSHSSYSVATKEDDEPADKIGGLFERNEGVDESGAEEPERVPAEAISHADNMTMSEDKSTVNEADMARPEDTSEIGDDENIAGPDDRSEMTDSENVPRPDPQSPKDEIPQETYSKIDTESAEPDKEHDSDWLSDEEEEAYFDSDSDTDVKESDDENKRDTAGDVDTEKNEKDSVNENKRETAVDIDSDRNLKEPVDENKREIAGDIDGDNSVKESDDENKREIAGDIDSDRNIKEPVDENKREIEGVIDSDRNITELVDENKKEIEGGIDSESSVNKSIDEDIEETAEYEKEAFEDESEQPEASEEPKPNISSDFKSSVDTSVWSASDEDIPSYENLETTHEENGGLGEAPINGFANVTSMFDVPPPRVEESHPSDVHDEEDEHELEEEIEPKPTVGVQNETDAQDRKSDIGGDDAKVDSNKIDEKRPKSGKPRRKGSFSKERKSSMDEERKETSEIRRQRSSRQNQNKATVGDDNVVLPLETKEKEKSMEEKTIPEESVSKRRDSKEGEKKRSRRKGRKSSNVEKVVEKDESVKRVQKETPEKLSDDKDAETSGAKVKVEQNQSKEVPVKKPRRPTSAPKPKHQEPRVSFDQGSSLDVESIGTDVSSERPSRRRNRRLRVPKIAETLYHQQPFTNEDMLDEKYIELFDIMRNDGIDSRELVKEVGVVLARAGLSPRSPHISPAPSPRVAKPKPKAVEEKFVQMHGVHDIPSVTRNGNQSVPVSKPVPAERHSLRRLSARKHDQSYVNDVDSFERTQKQLYRKYNELNALLNHQLPEESAYLVQEQLEQTLALLQRHQKQGHFHSKPDTSDNIGSQGQGRPKSAKSVSFRESRPGSGHESRSPQRRKGKKADLNDSGFVDENHTGDDSESDGQSRSRSRSFSPTDCSLRNTKNPDVRTWLREKNRKLRKQKRAERLRELEEHRKEEEEKKQKEEKAKESSEQVQNWLKQKRKDSRLLNKRETDIGHKFHKGPAVDASTEEIGTLNTSHGEVPGFADVDKLKAGTVSSSYRPRRPVSAPGVSSGRPVPIVSKRKPLAATADNVVISNKSKQPGTGRSVDSSVHDGSGGTSHAMDTQNINTHETVDTKTGTQKRPKSSKRRKKKENQPISQEEAAKADLLKKRLSYEQWLKEKRTNDNKLKQKEKQQQEKQQRESDHELNSLVPDLARRRIRFIESSKKRVDSGIRKIDENANSYPRVAGHEASDADGDKVNFSLNDNADVPTEEEERYQWRLEGEVSRPKSGRTSHGSRTGPSPVRPSSSPVSKTRARARLTMPKSTSSPRPRVENISEKGPNPFKSPIPVVNASLKRSGDARNRYAKNVWTNFSDDVWKQVNEEEGVGPFQVVEDPEGGQNEGERENQNDPSCDSGPGGLNDDASSGMPNGEASTEAPNGGASSEIPEGDVVTGGPIEVPSVADDRPDSASGNVNGSSPAPSTPNVNFGGIFYTVDPDGVQHGIHEASSHGADKTSPDHDDDDVEKVSKSDAKVSEDVPAQDPHKKKVNFGGIVYEVDKKESSQGSSSDVQEDDDIVAGGDDDDDDDANNSFFITSIDEDN